MVLKKTLGITLSRILVIDIKSLLCKGAEKHALMTAGAQDTYLKILEISYCCSCTLNPLLHVNLAKRSVLKS